MGPNGTLEAIVTKMEHVQPFNITKEAQSAKPRTSLVRDPRRSTTYFDWDLVTPTDAAPFTLVYSLTGYNPVPTATRMNYDNFTSQILIQQPIATIPITASDGGTVTVMYVSKLTSAFVTNAFAEPSLRMSSISRHSTWCTVAGSQLIIKRDAWARPPTSLSRPRSLFLI